MKMVRLWALVAVPCLALLALQSLGSGDEGEGAKAGPQVVATVLEVETAIEEINPPNLVVKAVGQVPTGGYSKAQLVRAVYSTPPADGIQDFFLLAVPPSGFATQVISEVKATHRWKGYTKEANWVKGVRVHGVGKGSVVKMLARGGE